MLTVCLLVFQVEIQEQQQFVEFVNIARHEFEQ